MSNLKTNLKYNRIGKELNQTNEKWSNKDNEESHTILKPDSIRSWTMPKTNKDEADFHKTCRSFCFIVFLGQEVKNTDLWK